MAEAAAPTAAAVVATLATAGSIFGDAALVLALIGGAFSGSVIGLSINPPATRRDAFFKGLCSALSAAVFSPLIIRLRADSLDVESVLFWSASVASLSWFAVLMVRNFDPKTVWNLLLDVILKSRRDPNEKP